LVVNGHDLDFHTGLKIGLKKGDGTILGVGSDDLSIDIGGFLIRIKWIAEFFCPVPPLW
jgi:hypothetical protein